MSDSLYTDLPHTIGPHPLRWFNKTFTSKWHYNWHQGKPEKGMINCFSIGALQDTSTIGENKGPRTQLYLEEDHVARFYKMASEYQTQFPVVVWSLQHSWNMLPVSNPVQVRTFIQFYPVSAFSLSVGSKCHYFFIPTDTPSSHWGWGEHEINMENAILPI